MSMQHVSELCAWPIFDVVNQRAYDGGRDLITWTLQVFAPNVQPQHAGHRGKLEAVGVRVT